MAALNGKWPHHVAIWVAVGGVLGATQCHWVRPARSAATASRVLWDGPLPTRPDVAPSVVVHVPHRAIRHVVGI